MVGGRVAWLPRLLSVPVSATRAPRSTLVLRLRFAALIAPALALPRRACRLGDGGLLKLGGYGIVGEPSEEDSEGGGTEGYESVLTAMGVVPMSSAASSRFRADVEEGGVVYWVR